jgi:alpha-beta hydrolase superfamily lysophospholipase
MSEEVKNEIPKVKVPFKCIHGAADIITLPASSAYLFDHAATPADQKSIEYLTGLRHETLHEKPPAGAATIDKVVAYFESQLNAF